MAEHEDKSEHEDRSVSDATVARVAKSVVDVGLPGFSLYMDGDYSEGLMHTAAGLGASFLLGGPLGMWLAAADFDRAFLERKAPVAARTVRRRTSPAAPPASQRIRQLELANQRVRARYRHPDLVVPARPSIYGGDE